MRSRVRLLVRRLAPPPLFRRLVRLTRWPPVGRVRLGDFRRLTPLGSPVGPAPAQPVVDYYLEKFLRASVAEIKGRLLRIGDAGGGSRLPVEVAATAAACRGEDRRQESAAVATLDGARELPDESFDCVLCLQALPFVYDLKSAVRTLYRLLRPGGALLATVPGISPTAVEAAASREAYWRFTDASGRRLFASVFAPDQVEVRVFGNVLAAALALHGLGAENLDAGELDHLDPDYQVLIGIRALKAGAAG